MATPELPPGLQLVLSDGAAPGGALERLPAAAVEILSDADTRALLARLPEVEAAPRAEFALRPASMPPPRTGKTVDLPFPPPVTPAAPVTPTGPVKVLRWQPEGEIPLASHVSITFDRPMVALTTQDAAAAQVPVTLRPEPAGHWRWVGTRTLLFEPDLRMPMATTYSLSLAAGAKAPDGSTVEEALEATFATPPLQLRAQVPSGGEPSSTRPVIVMAFDQAVDADALREVVEVSAGGRPVAMRAPTPEEIAGSPEAKALLERTRPGRFVAMIPSEPLATREKVRVTLPRGAPSAEGPRLTPSDQSFGFRVHGPLALQTTRCGWNGECRPGWPFRLQLSNALDHEQDLEDLVTVSPEIPGMTVSISGRDLTIQGRTSARTTYAIQVAGGLRDVFGQTLGRDVTTTTKVGDAEPAWPSVYSAGGQVQVPDPFADPSVGFVVQGLDRVRVRISRVRPGDWPGYARPPRTRDGAPPSPGELLVDEVRDIPGDPNIPQLFAIDLTAHTDDGVGQLVVEVQSPRSRPRNRFTWSRVWVSATRIGLAVFADAGEAYVLATDLRTGRALPGVEVRLSDRPVGTTDDQGWLHLDALSSRSTPAVLHARKGEDLTLLTPGHGRPWHGGEAGTRTAWFVFDDRKLYRPAETVHVKGWVRRIDHGEGGDLLAPDGSLAGPVSWSLKDAVQNELSEGTVSADTLGGFDLDLTLPDTPNLGTALLELRHDGDRHLHTFEIQEFRRPEFEVSAVVEEAGPHVVGTSVTAAVTARYYAGGVLPGAATRWSVQARKGDWDPPGWDDFRFGVWEPWWWRCWWLPEEDETQWWNHEGETDATGVHRLNLDLRSVSPPRPMALTAQATVEDVNRQAWTATASMLLHPSTRYVGLKPLQSFVEAGERVEAELVVVDLEGEAEAGVTVNVAFVRKRALWKRGEWVEEEAERHEARVTSGAEPVKCTFVPEEGGRFEIIAVAADAEGRPNRTTVPVWVAGGVLPPQVNGVEQQDIVLVPDAETYEPGDVAEVLVQAPFAPAEGIVTWRRSGIVHAERLVIEDGSATISIPVEEGHVPNLAVQVDLFGQADRTAGDGSTLEGVPPRPAYATGRFELKVPPLHRDLAVEVKPETDAAAPGESTYVDVIVRDAAGSPVGNAQVAVIMVDEAVLALTGYRIPDPIDTFHPQRPDGATDHHGRAWVVLADPEALMGDTTRGELQALGYAGAAADFEMTETVTLRSMKAAEPMAASPMEEADAGEAAPPIALRTDFRADALWAPSVATDRSGRARVPVDLPDSLTRYRITAVAVDGGKQFGKGEADLTVRLPLMLRPSPPRFLNFGDQAELPLVVQNQTDGMVVVDLALRADNAAIDGKDRGGRRTRVPPGDRVEIRFPVSTTSAGRATFQAALSSGSWSDAAAFDFPVWTPATTEAFAVYGHLDGPEGTAAMKQAVSLPRDVVPAFGGLDIETSSSALQALTDAFLYLVDYPYGCAEQIASRVLSVAALKEVLEAFDAEGLPDPDALNETVGKDLEELAFRQNDDGSWGFWRRHERPSVYTTLHVTHALLRAKEAGWEVDGDSLQRALNRIERIDGMFDRHWSEAARNVARAQALMLRHLAGERVGKGAVALYRKGGGTEALPLEALGWLLPSLHEANPALSREIRRFLDNRAAETAGTAQWVSSYAELDDALLLHGARRTDAVLLDALLQVDPDHDLLPKVVEGLLGARVRGRWSSTQENAWVLLALKRYFHVAEAVTPDFVARAWIGDGYAGDHTFEGRTTEQARIHVPMPWLSERPEQDLVLAREGAGRLYYRLGLRYAPADLNLDPAERGFAVTRTYEAVDDPDEVRLDGDGVWHIRPGARVRVTLRMVAPARRYHVALVDPLPAGLEPLNPALSTTEDVPPPENADDPWLRPWWWGRWYDHENLRDERVEAFARQVGAGVHTYRYVARATTPGTFVVPPAKAEEMYHPETFGRTGTDRVVVD